MEKQAFIDQVEKDITEYFDAVGKRLTGEPERGFTDRDLPQLLRAVRGQAETLWDRYRCPSSPYRDQPVVPWTTDITLASK